MAPVAGPDDRWPLSEQPELRCRRDLAHFGEIITRLADVAGRFTTAPDCADISFLPDGILDQLPLPGGHQWRPSCRPRTPRTKRALAASATISSGHPDAS